jgi:hypothetical protein
VILGAALAVLLGLSVTPASADTTASVSDLGLAAVGCPTANHCFAVGTGGAVATLSFGRWTSRPGPRLNGMPVAFNDISCPTTTRCVAVGTSVIDSRDQGVVYTWNGVFWRLADPVSFSGIEPLSVSCSGATFCMVGFDNVLSTTPPFAATGIAGRWTLATLPATNGFDPQQLRVSCSSPFSCVGVGLAVDRDFVANGAYTWSRAGWSSPTVTDFVAATNIRCAGARSCNALEISPFTDDPPFQVSHYDGSTWTAAPPSLTGPTLSSASLFLAACSRTGGCLAVGSTGANPIPVAVRLHGTSGVTTPMPLPSGATTGLIAAGTCVGLRDCYAVGSAPGQAALIEHFDGWHWKVQPVH